MIEQFARSAGVDVTALDARRLRRFRTADDASPEIIARVMDSERLLLEALRELDAGYPDRALERLEILRRDVPGDAEIENQRGRALNNLARFCEAEQAFREALRLVPDFVDAQRHLGHVLHAQGRAQEAVDAFRTAVRLDPNDARGHLGLGVALMACGEAADASESFRRAAVRAPDNFSAHYNLGVALHELGRTHDAVTAYREAAALRPDDPDVLSNLGASLHAEGEIEEAGACYQRALDINAAHEPALAALAGLMDLRGEYQTGIAMLQTAIDAGSASPRLLVAYAQLLRRAGRQMEVIDILRQALSRTDLHPEACLLLHFTLGDLYDGAGDYRNAFEHYRRANQLKGAHFDAAAYHRYVSGIIESFSEQRLRQLPRAHSASQRPVFIVGMPRSGTSLVEQILASHPDVSGAGELKDICQAVAGLAGDVGYPQLVDSVRAATLDEAAERYLDRLTALDSQAARVTDKMWQNFEYLGVIALMFPRARVIHCTRNPLDTALSCYFQSFGVGGPPFSYDLGHLGAYSRDYRRLMVHWQRTLQLPILDVSYEALITDVEGVSRRMIEFLGLDWDDACLRFHENDRVVRTASHAQVRRPIYMSSVGRAEHYRAFIQSLIAALQE